MIFLYEFFSFITLAVFSIWCIWRIWFRRPKQPMSPEDVLFLRQTVPGSIRVVENVPQMWDLAAQQAIPLGTLVFVKDTNTLYVATLTNGWTKV